jgi:methyl-accepting chemotaxis protein
MEVVMSASEGKLSVQLPEVSEGELGVITSALGMMLTSWSGIIADMRSVSATAEQLLASVNEASSEVETSAGVQGERIVHTTSSITALNQDLQQMSSGATHAAEASAKALSQANDGEKVIRQAVTGADNLRTQVQLTAKRVKSMADRSTEIGEILAIINQIASETKLLSINASIEATRAGEEGKSFAVVADSVGDLAEKTQAEAIRIRDMVKAMQADAAESVAAIERQTTAVESEVKLLAEAGSAQELIKNSSTRSSQAVAEIAQTATKQVEVMRQTVAIMHDVSQLAAGTSQASRRSRASVDQLQVQMKTLADKLAQFT